MKPFTWKRQVCLITGATGGIGEAIAIALAEKGASLILTGRNHEKLSALLSVLPGHHTLVCADITQPEGIDKVLSVCRAKAPTMLINNAGVAVTGDFTQTPEADIGRVITTNLVAPIILTQRLLPLLRHAKEAHVINVGSTFGSIGFPCHSLYCASKFGLRGWTESLMREYVNTGVRFLYLAPRATRTSINSSAVVEMNEALGNQMDEPAEVADALITQVEKGQRRRFLGLPEMLFARINGAFPGLVDRALIKKLPTIQQFMSSTEKETML
ncbi:SDR family oxidoreductase [Alteromonas sp. H39]|uniref:SDR family oxidoreductase n=1 Tax=Alteromonas sp. H39 TaxID=3389876 RepID=UPI0039E006A9